MKKFIFLVGLTILITLSACNNNASDNKVIVEMEGTKITEAEFVQLLKEKYGEHVLAALVEEKIYEEHAKQLKIKDEDVDAEVKMVREVYGLEDEDSFKDFLLSQNFANEDAFRKIVTQHLVIQKIASKDVEVTDEQLTKEYEMGEEVEANHILVDDLDTAKEVIEKLNSGEDFEELAKEYSTDTVSASKGGSLGYFGRGKMVPQFEETAFSLNNNEISKPVQSDYGYHIIKVTNRKPFEKSLEDVRDQLKDLLARRQARPSKEVQAEIIENANINVLDKQFENVFKKND